MPLKKKIGVNRLLLNNMKIKRILEGVVVSDKMDKTRVVEVERWKVHKKYKKRYKVRKRFKVHDEKNEHKVGNKVIIEETRPLSKEKKWRVIGKVT